MKVTRPVGVDLELGLGNVEFNVLLRDLRRGVLALLASLVVHGLHCLLHVAVVVTTLEGQRRGGKRDGDLLTALDTMLGLDCKPGRRGLELWLQLELLDVVLAPEAVQVLGHSPALADVLRVHIRIRE